ATRRFGQRAGIQRQCLLPFPFDWRTGQPDDLWERGDQMKTFLVVVASLALSVSARAQVLPTLPQVWIDNNEATDGVNCGGYCSGVGYAAPAYELSLPSTWVAGPPAGCSFNTPYWSGSPTQAGLQSAINDIETCRTAHSGTVCTILDIPPFNYSNTTGTVVPQSSYTVVPTVTGCFNILRS